MDHHAENDEQHDAPDSESRHALVVPQMNDLKIDTATEADDHPDDCDRESIASEDFDDSVMEPFDDYKPKIQCLLNDIGLPDCEAEVIQHGYQYQNCVYALKSPRTTDEQYVLDHQIVGKDCSKGVISASVGIFSELRSFLHVSALMHKNKLPDGTIRPSKKLCVFSH
ncbi:MAG: hypothetical protein LQ350_004020 [Teloschistes chrysophthalmus]|nr:MAG: hypothetical protein LQ350_004020 [Niorma chrysophthalma]